MQRDKPIISIKEARKILGSDAVGMDDEEIADVITALDILAQESLAKAKLDIKIKKDAKDLANLIYDIYQDKNETDKQ